MYGIPSFRKTRKEKKLKRRYRVYKKGRPIMKKAKKKAKTKK